ncbi:hypothetical protein [Cupriavidus taiwanensis]|uniref:hypothetical protein n=1 Tax=Cupriavidus taiwanensis TaxID=164546 RepID=UPI000E174B95|nr:hypothetical protein [Cupriavidus taiwanensis]SPA17215.1 hypothetical protein CBM2631_A90291 [Cupriavidus taiwanensis]
MEYFENSTNGFLRPEKSAIKHRSCITHKGVVHRFAGSTREAVYVAALEYKVALGLGRPAEVLRTFRNAAGGWVTELLVRLQRRKAGAA